MPTSVKDGTFPALCHACHNLCGVLVTVEGGRAVSVTGDRDNPRSRGYSCVKGRALPDILNGPERLHQSLKRGDGGFAPISSTQATQEIATRIRALVNEHGPRSVALYVGTQVGNGNPISMPMMQAFGKALGTPMITSSASIDQPGKFVAAALHGSWMTPPRTMEEADVGLFFGINPPVSHMSHPGPNPNEWLKTSNGRGTKIIVVDPRRTELARRAYLHLQPVPGEDIAILAAMVRVILDEGLKDEAFIAENVVGDEALRASVDAYEVDAVARRAGVRAQDIVLAARTVAAAERLYAAAGTGSNMGQSGTVMEYLLLAVQTVCGGWRRAGERVPNPGTLLPASPMVAQAAPPVPAIAVGTPMRVHDFVSSILGVQVAAVPDEILLEGDGQIRALISAGGNPAVAWPDQGKTIRALKKLELLVQIDPFLSQTAQLAHYVIAPKMCLETPMTSSMEEVVATWLKSFAKHQPFAQHNPPRVDVPPGSDLVEEWEFFFDLGKHLDLQMTLEPLTNTDAASAMDMTATYTAEELLEIFHRGSRIPLSVVKEHPHGALFEDPSARVAPKEEGWSGRLDVGHPEMLRDIRANAADMGAGDEEYPYRVISRRMNHVYNSSYNNIPRLTKGRPYNPAFMHPSDLEALGLVNGGRLRITSRVGAIVAFAESDDTVRPGCVSIGHAFGSAETGREDEDIETLGSSTSRLCSMDVGFDRFQGQPLMSSIPVKLERIEGAAAQGA